MAISWRLEARTDAETEVTTDRIADEGVVTQRQVSFCRLFVEQVQRRSGQLDIGELDRKRVVEHEVVLHVASAFTAEAATRRNTRDCEARIARAALVRHAVDVVDRIACVQTAGVDVEVGIGTPFGQRARIAEVVAEADSVVRFGHQDIVHVEVVRGVLDVPGGVTANRNHAEARIDVVIRCKVDAADGDVRTIDILRADTGDIEAGGGSLDTGIAGERDQVDQFAGTIDCGSTARLSVTDKAGNRISRSDDDLVLEIVGPVVGTEGECAGVDDETDVVGKRGFRIECRIAVDVDRLVVTTSCREAVQRGDEVGKGYEYI